MDKVIEYCKTYDIPIDYLDEIISDPKVIPMIRGKAFEFSALVRFKEILNEKIWKVEKPVMNAQFGVHDQDVKVTHTATGEVVSIECKLAAKGKYKKAKGDKHEIRIKCMRSRTLGLAKVKELAPKIGVSEAALSVHNDQYIMSDFDLVVTSIANAFYETNQTTKAFFWCPSKDGTMFLKDLLNEEDDKKLKPLAYDKIYIAKSSDLTVKKGGYQTCSRQKCKDDSCGFIPNYPIIKFEKKGGQANLSEEKKEEEKGLRVTNGWCSVEDCEGVLLEIINKKIIKKAEARFGELEEEKSKIENLIADAERGTTKMRDRLKGTAFGLRSSLANEVKKFQQDFSKTKIEEVQLMEDKLARILIGLRERLDKIK